jgi:hypothetical protein
MPPSAYAILVLFLVVSVLCGAGAAFLVGPRRVRAALIPTMAAFLALYWVGHRSGLELGPTVELFGFRVALLQDVLAAVVAALAAALAQRWIVGQLRTHAPGPGVR